MLVFWLLAAILCLATVLMLLAVKAPIGLAEAGRSEGALAIYKDQLAELDRDVAAGVVGADEAEAQRTEISRRLLAAGREVAEVKTASQKFPKVLALAVPLFAALVYWQIGNYYMADIPRADRLAQAEKILAALRDNPDADASGLDWDATLAVVEDQQAKTPDNLQGWKFLTSSYLNLGRFADAENAMSEIIRIAGPSADLYADLAEIVVFQNKGLTSDRSAAIVAEALKLDDKHPKALYYRALDFMQKGQSAEAKLILENLLVNAPADAPWRSAVDAQLAKLKPNATAPDISAEQVQDGLAMKPEDRMAMIKGMVDGLDEKLKTNPEDIEGWLRLIRARTVLQDGDKAVAALTTARTTFATKPEQLKALDDLAKELNLK
jgi:cytochrome c-type biogenesis protein CcmH